MVRVGVIGVGPLGQHHARNYSGLPGCKLVGVADIDRKAASRIASAFRTQAFFDHRTLLDKVDAVSIVVPTFAHYQTAKDFLDRGIHVLVEKPITNDLNQARELINLARDRNLILQVGHIERFNVAVQRMRQILDRPCFIECHRLGPYEPRVKDVGVVLDLMIHDIDIVLQIVNSPIASIDAVGVPILSPREDIANARITFENGCTANLTVSRVTPNKLRKIRIFQADAYISLDYQKQNMEVYTRETIENAGPDEPKAQIVRKKIRLKKEEPLRAELLHFIECVRKGEEPQVTGEHGHNALQVAIKITDLIRQKQSRIEEVYGLRP
ncbi:Gfo/Idh/MocA family oxidoreductase [Candidatus Sumerlaeota bacterium]|nr:Gfo/Idh/MocA family oxidoreductase [Candidatus Sumerlaeota bacterium]